jgi:hypothetical protein
MELPYSRRIVALVGGRGGGAGEEIFVAYELYGSPDIIGSGCIALV